jgi:hypothetical protein
MAILTFLLKIWCGFGQIFKEKFPFSKKAPFFFGSPSGEIWPPKQYAAYVITSTICRIEEKTKIDDKVLGKYMVQYIVNNIFKFHLFILESDKYLSFIIY